MTSPNKWVVLKVEPKTPDGELHYRVFGVWFGGYLSGQSWRMNSGIESVDIDGNYYLFHGASGSVYRCHKDSYGLSAYGMSVLSGLIDDAKERVDISQMPSDTDWANFKFN